MRAADIEFAISLTDTEKWGYSSADFRRLLRLDPLGCLLATVGGRRVGITTATSYGKVGWIGNVIIAPEHRGEGIGALLVERAMGYLEKKGAESIRLNSYLHVVDFYERMGFKRIGENVRLHGRMKRADGSARSPRLPDLRSIASFDKRFFGADRTRLLHSLRQEFPETFISLGNGRIRGYIVGQPTDGSCEIAPWVVDPSHSMAAKELWLELSRRLGGTQVAFTAPSSSKLAGFIAKWAGLRPSFRTIRMCRGRSAYAGRIQGTLALGGLEKG